MNGGNVRRSFDLAITLHDDAALVGLDLCRRRV
jgi:hypothetical protein